MSSFTLRHIPVLLVATSTTFGGAAALPYPVWAIRAFGFPERIVQAPIAHSSFTLSSIRTSCMGLMLYTFMWRGQYEVVDTMLAIIGFYLGVADSYLCWREGVPGKAVFRLVSSFCVGLWGAVGMTKG